jgi:hypothetical protein
MQRGKLRPITMEQGAWGYVITNPLQSQGHIHNLIQTLRSLELVNNSTDDRLRYNELRTIQRCGDQFVFQSRKSSGRHSE